MMIKSDYLKYNMGGIVALLSQISKAYHFGGEKYFAGAIMLIASKYSGSICNIEPAETTVYKEGFEEIIKAANFGSFKTFQKAWRW